ncbi:MAG: hypothetical protein IPP74_14945 [Alphaproteobacteria bacterium]|nr:hypothetical protein [Alphaproteobacteria bacterium]
MPLGISARNLDPSSTLALHREIILFPTASSATEVVASADISASVAGDALTIAKTAPFLYPRKLLFTRTDASGSNLAISVLVVGKRFGRTISETLTIASGSSAQTVKSTKIYDEVTSATIISIANNAASDTCSLGTDTLWLGLQKPIKSYKSVRHITIISAIPTTPDATVSKVQADLSSSLVVGGLDSAIDVGTLFSTTIAITQGFVIDYFQDGEPDFIRRLGVKYG